MTLVILISNTGSLTMIFLMMFPCESTVKELNRLKHSFISSENTFLTIVRLPSSKKSLKYNQTPLNGFIHYLITKLNNIQDIEKPVNTKLCYFISEIINNKRSIQRSSCWATN